ncbi:hypothetical protein Aduo_006425 [Ancylostoma duodenale]
MSLEHVENGDHDHPEEKKTFTRSVNFVVETLSSGGAALCIEDGNILYTRTERRIPQCLQIAHRTNVALCNEDGNIFWTRPEHGILHCLQVTLDFNGWQLEESTEGDFEDGDEENASDELDKLRVSCVPFAL